MPKFYDFLSTNKRPARLRGPCTALVQGRYEVYAKMARSRPGGNCSSKNTEKTR